MIEVHASNDYMAGLEKLQEDTPMTDVSKTANKPPPPVSAKPAKRYKREKQEGTVHYFFKREYSQNDDSDH